MDASLRKLVATRAGNRCEYCLSPQAQEPFFNHHVEHIIPRQHGGVTVDHNLALACHHCNLHKGPNLTGIDPDDGKIIPLFNPRTQVWTEHFERRGVTIAGRTAVGRATVRVMDMNSPPRLRLRAMISR